MRLFVPIVWCLFALTACNNSTPPAADKSAAGGHDHAHDHAHDHGHDHGHSHGHDAGPHEGHIVEVGDEQYHLEWVHDDETGEVTIYILNGSMQEEVAIEAEQLTIEIAIDNNTRQHTLTAVPESAAGEGASKFTTTDKSLIEALKIAGQGVDAKLPIEIGGESFTVTFEHEPH